MPQQTSSPFDDPVYALVLINLDTGEGFHFNLFPQSIEVGTGSNWRPRPVTHGTMPLNYANNNPEKVTFSTWLDRAAQGESVSPDIVKLMGWMKPAEGQGAPPPLLLSWGDTDFRCVLEELKVTEKYFDAEGRPRRAELNLTFVELQEDDAAGARSLVAPAASQPSPVPSGQDAGGHVFGPEP
jgi:hypothetical protein